MITTLTSIVNTLVATGVVDFPANYKITNKDHVFVYYVDGEEAEVLLVQVTSFTAGSPNEYKVNAITESGFNVELRDAYDTSDGRKISTRRVLPLTQEVDYPPGNDFPAATHERALDKLTAIVQQFNETVSRQIGIPLSEDAEETTLPAYIPNYYLGLDGDNDLIWKVGTVAVGNNEIKDSHIDWGTGLEQVSAVDMPIADVGSIITATEVEGALQENRAALDIEEAAMILFNKGMIQIVLTNYTGTGVPAIAANSLCEINGVLYTNPSEVTITGTTVDSTWYDILLTPSGSSFIASFVARDTGAWSDSKHGLYSVNNRIVAGAYRVGATNWINKNIYIVTNRTVKIKMEIGDWNMVSSDLANVAHKMSATLLASIRSMDIIIRNDGGFVKPLIGSYQTTADLYRGGSIFEIDSTEFILTRAVGGIFDSTDYDSTSYNRGWITIEYEV